MKDFCYSVLSALRASGETADMLERAGRTTLHLTGTNTQLDEHDIVTRAFLHGIPGWRARKLPDEPGAAARTILARTAQQRRNDALLAEERRRSIQRRERRERLQAAFGSRAQVYDESIVFTPPLTPDEARAIVALLAKETAR